MKVSHAILIVTYAAGFGACVPAHLAKYQRGTRGVEELKGTKEDATAHAQAAIRTEGRAETPVSPRNATIYAVDDKTFRFHLSQDEVWDAALSVLLRNYNLTVVDKDSGVLTTEWDTFYLDRAVYRNKVSMRIRRAGRGAVEVTIHNAVERLQDGAAAGAVGALWLPDGGYVREVGRIVQNMAMALDQPPPSLPESMLARDVLDPSNNQPRR